ncbi:MAG: hypothetical protein KatS3mg129_3107 [Leptospiraceae bacterium]|nr:MAG: hypothetical protein KatS3mg129_3107 [Leptospiraceae bacterium]
MKPNKYIIFLFFITISLFAQENIELSNKKNIVRYTEKWTAIEGVKKYRLEIYDLSNKPIFIKETEKNEIEVELPPGKYKKRLGLINPFNQIFLYTDWKDFEILEIPTPKVSYIEKKTIDTTKNQENIQVSITGITKTTKIYLKDKYNKIIPITYKQIDTNRMILEINPKSLEEGNYNLIVKNSENKKLELPNVLKIEKPKSTFKPLIANWKLLIPGLPQRERNQYTKANILQWGFIGSLFSAGYFYNEAIRYQKKYDSLILTQLGNNLISASGTVQFFQTSTRLLLLTQQSQQLEKTIDNFNKNKNLFYFSIGLSVLFYSYHIIDVVYYEFYVSPQKKEIGAKITFQF